MVPYVEWLQLAILLWAGYSLYDSVKSDGLPVHLKRGLPDRLLYRTTMALTLGGTIYCLIALYMAAQPKNKK
ncbi:hypothetical protein XELAEV_18028729mg [Xenopus laevis]|uniref:Uncharacterized protein n=1 Tax=Xenopus laevis TaxID=8355 RepID=A0A974CRN4_XENLA|nr:hypothetical protein XELAEV_18028729mg [Xenopus laevis]